MLHVEFSGKRAGTAPLTWGQRHIWRQIERLRPNEHFLNNAQVLTLPEGDSDPWAGTCRPDATAVARALGTLIGRHESLRTTLVTVNGEIHQAVTKTGAIPLEVVETDHDHAVDAAETVRERLYRTRFRHFDELPIRTAVVTVGGRAVHVVLCVGHLAVDGRAMWILLRELWLLLVRGPLTTKDGPEPLDLARLQNGPEAHRRRRSALAYWTAAWRRIPPSMFTPAGPAHDPPFQRRLINSRAAYLATHVIAARHHVSTSTVLMAAGTALVSALTRHDTCAMLIHAVNRYRRDHRSIVGTLSQRGLCVLDVGDRPLFDTLVPRVWQAALLAYRNSSYDQFEMDEALARTAMERGIEIHPNFCFNDVRFFATDNDSAAARAGRATVDDARPATVVSIPRQPERMDCGFCVEVHDAPPGTMSVLVTADTRCLPPADIEGFLWSMEELLIHAAFGDVRICDLSVGTADPPAARHITDLAWYRRDPDVRADR